MGSGQGPRITVLQDLDGARIGHGAFWGEVNSNVHKALGCLGVVTDGCIRDLDMIADGFQMLAGSVKPSHSHVHVVDFGKPVSVAGMLVHHGDLIHADRHGAVVIPHHVARDIPRVNAELAAKEKVILDIVKAPGFTFDKLKAALVGPKDIH
jgi:regulator of RNase E activity RraA